MRLGGILGALEVSWRRLGSVLGCLGSVLGRLGASWERLAASWARLRVSCVYSMKIQPKNQRFHIRKLSPETTKIIEISWVLQYPRAFRPFLR